MPIFFKVDFHCEACGADIVYEDEVPLIKKDRAAVVENNKAEKWIKRWNEDKPPLGHMPAYPKNIVIETFYVALLKPESIPRLSLDMVKYIICTVCGERIYFA